MALDNSYKRLWDDIDRTWIDNDTTESHWSGPPPHKGERMIRDVNSSHTLGYQSESYTDRTVKQMTRDLDKVGIMYRLVERKERLRSPHGSGPMKRVRMGDDFVPKTVYIIVIDELAELADTTIEAGAERQVNILKYTTDKLRKVKSLGAEGCDFKRQS